MGHEDLPVEECEQATTIAGCAFHPAPYLVNCTGYVAGALIHHDGDTCPQHEDDGSYGPSVTFPTPRNNLPTDIDYSENEAYQKEIWKQNYLNIGEVDDHGTPVPVVMNKIIDKYTENLTPVRKENKMDSILNDLRDKLDEVTNVRDELESLQRDLEEAIENANSNIDSLEEAINALDINLEDIEFEADIRFDGSY